MMTPLTKQLFRQTFPSFNADAFPDSAVDHYVLMANIYFAEEDRWIDNNVRLHLMCLYVAHFLTMHSAAALGGDASAYQGAGSGAVSSKSVDGASISYDPIVSSEFDGGSWNSTSFGKELYRTMRMFGAGGIQI